MCCLLTFVFFVDVDVHGFGRRELVLFLVRVFVPAVSESVVHNTVHRVRSTYMNNYILETYDAMEHLHCLYLVYAIDESIFIGYNMYIIITSTSYFG